MSKALCALVLVCAVAGWAPALAVNPGFQVTMTGTVGPVVLLSVHNTTGIPVSGRVRVTVRLVDDTYETLTSGAFTLAGGATISVTLTSIATVSEIEDSPEPIGLDE